MQCAGLGVDASLGRFKAGLRELIFQLRDVAGGFELLGGTLQFQRFLRYLITSCGRLIFRLQRLGLGRVGASTLAGIKQWDLQGKANCGVVRSKTSLWQIFGVVIEG